MNLILLTLYSRDLFAPAKKSFICYKLLHVSSLITIVKKRVKFMCVECSVKWVTGDPRGHKGSKNSD